MTVFPVNYFWMALNKKECFILFIHLSALTSREGFVTVCILVAPSDNQCCRDSFVCLQMWWITRHLWFRRLKTDLCFHWHPDCQPAAPAVVPVPHFSCVSCLRSVAVPSVGCWTRHHTSSSTCPPRRDWPAAATREGAGLWSEGWAGLTLHRTEYTFIIYKYPSV